MITIEALACREVVNGRISTMIHNEVENVGAEKWTLVPLDKFRGLTPEEIERTLNAVIWSVPLTDMSSLSENSQCRRNSTISQEGPAMMKVRVIIISTQPFTWLQSEDPSFFLM